MKFNPSIQILPHPINYQIDDVEGDDNASPIYNVIVSFREIKINFLVTQRPPWEADREYEVIRASHLVITDVRSNPVLRNAKIDSSIGNDVTITNEVLKFATEPFGIRLLDINVHSHTFIESNCEGRGFIFEDIIKYEELKDKINDKCKKMMNVSNIR